MYKLFASFLYIFVFVLFVNADDINTTATIKFKSKELYLKYTKYPKNVYTNQRFSTELEAIILTTKDKFHNIITSYKKKKNIEIIDNNITWKYQGNHKYTTKITYKAKNKSFKLPIVNLSLEMITVLKDNSMVDINTTMDINVTVDENITLDSNITMDMNTTTDQNTTLDSNITFENNITKDINLTDINVSNTNNSIDMNITKKPDIIIKNIINSIDLLPPRIKYNKIAINQTRFSNIIADDLKINSIQTKQFNNQMLMVVFNITVENGNLEDIYISQFKDQGIKDFIDTYPVQNTYYYIIVPNHISNIKFDYYNPKSSSFITVELPVVLEEDLISTQIDLNPHDNNLILYKQISLLILLLIFVLLYTKYNNKIFIILSAICLTLLIKLLLPHETTFIKNDAKVYILPTNSSTIYKQVNRNKKVEILMKRDDFIKVLFEDKTIGWIKENDIR